MKHVAESLSKAESIDALSGSIWYPCTQMQDHEAMPPMPVVGAKGPYLELADGRKIIDVISSWWTKPFGHGQPQIKVALEAQLAKFEHVLLPGTSSEVVENVAHRLAQITAPLDKTFFASDGCCAVEIAMKMSLHVRMVQGENKRTRFLALENSYHGETLGALAVSDCDRFRQAYEPLLAPVTFLKGIPYVSGIDDPLWHDCAEAWQACQPQLEGVADDLTAIIIEPIMQGAGGMLIYSADFLKRLAAWAKAKGIHLICDEIASGFGRTGQMLAYQHSGIAPDFVCLSKAITGGYLPMSVTQTSSEIYDALYGHPFHRSFLHSNTFAGNPLAAACADAALQLLVEGRYDDKAAQMQSRMMCYLQEVADNTGQLTNLRGIGAMVAADLQSEAGERRGWAVYQEALKRGLLLRPLGNTLYWFPPIGLSSVVLHSIAEKTTAAINAVAR